jgi:hypothetical protein
LPCRKILALPCRKFFAFLLPCLASSKIHCLALPCRKFLTLPYRNCRKLLALLFLLLCFAMLYFRLMLQVCFYNIVLFFLSYCIVLNNCIAFYCIVLIFICCKYSAVQC